MPVVGSVVPCYMDTKVAFWEKKKYSRASILKTSCTYLHNEVQS